MNHPTKTLRKLHVSAGTPGVRGRIRVPTPVLAVVAVGVVLVLYPRLVTTSFGQNVGVLALTIGIAATGWNLLGGFTGQVSFGHALFFGTGMYGTAMLVERGWSPWLAAIPCMAIAAALAVLIGLPCFRLRGHYFSIATIAVGEIAFTIVLTIAAFGAAQGISVPSHDESVWNLQLSLRDKTAYYEVALGLFGFATLVAWLFVRSRAGRYVRAVRDDERAAAAVGIPVLRYKLLAAALSAAITALAGMFQVMHVLFVDPPSGLDLSISISIALVAVVGGAGSLWGPLLGAWVVVFLQEYTRTHWSSTGRTIDLLVYGALITVVAIAEPRGLVGLIRRGYRAVLRLRDRPRAEAVMSS